MLLSFLISIVGLLFLLINSILYIKTRTGKESSYSFLMVYLSVLFVVELVCHIIGFLNPNSNFFLSHYYFIIQFIVLSLFFYQVFEDRRIKVVVLLNLIGVNLVLGIQYFMQPELYWEFNLLEIGVTSSVLLLYCAFHFYQNLKTSYQYFFFCFGLSFYLTSSMLIFLSGNTALVFFEEPFYFDIWIFNSLFYIFYQFMIYREWQSLNKKISLID